jgi:hypothetical protein
MSRSNRSPLESGIAPSGPVRRHASDAASQPPARRVEVTVPGLDREPLRDANYVGEILAIPPKTVLQYARDGRLPCVRIGKHARFLVSEIEAALTAGR